MTPDIAKFLIDNIYLVVIALISGGMLLWPLLRQGGSGEVGTLQATMLINQKDAWLFDLRDAGDYAKGHILNARSLPLAQLDGKVDSLAKNKEKNLIVYCETGRVAGTAVAKLRKAGYVNAVGLSGGIAAWRQAGLPVAAD